MILYHDVFCIFVNLGKDQLPKGAFTKTWSNGEGSVLRLCRAISSTWDTGNRQRRHWGHLALKWCPRAELVPPRVKKTVKWVCLPPRFPEAVHGKKHLDNFQNKTKLLCRYLEFSACYSLIFGNLTPVIFLVRWQWSTESNRQDWAQEDLDTCERDQMRAIGVQHCPAV